MRIELATEADVPRCLEMANWAAAHTTANFAVKPETLESWVGLFQKTQHQHPWLVAREDDAAIGFAKSGPHRPREAYDWSAELSVYIDPAWHGRGVGRALYAALLPLLREQGYVTLLAGITAGHAASEALHARFGFTRCGTFHRVGWKQGAWHDVSYWELHLSDGPAAPIRPVAAVCGPRLPATGR